ncbi:MAG: prepilin-type N-terminal cleavage/methylation domain-containing protein [Phycisphaerales bacterium]|nr:MAG: prepilin-type N-terminal cleavage/methylation domain-containing protein [Phycisphaerales bacterium]
MNRRARSNGFTLVEILLATAIIVTIVSMVYGGYFAVSKSAGACRTAMTLSGRARRTLLDMCRQIRCSYAGKITEPVPPAGTSGLSTNEAAGSLVTYFTADSYNRDGEILRFVTTKRLFCEQKDSAGLFEVTYRLDATEGTLFLNQRRFVADTKGPAEDKRWRPVLTDVTAVELAFSDGKRWLGEWDFKRMPALPRAVRIDITCEDENHRQYRCSTVEHVVGHGGAAGSGPAAALTALDSK